MADALKCEAEATLVTLDSWNNVMVNWFTKYRSLCSGNNDAEWRLITLGPCENFLCVSVSWLSLINHWSIFGAQHPNSGLDRVIVDVSRYHTHTYTHTHTHTFLWTSHLVAEAPTYTLRAQETYIYAFSGIGTRGPCRRMSAGPRIRPHGHGNRQPVELGMLN
jgi:hypothetical protein